MKWAVIALVACGSGSATIQPAETSALPAHREVSLDDGIKGRKRMVPTEAFLRAYLTWFGGLAPEEVQHRVRGELFDRWVDYLGSLGLPDYELDAPRATQSNTVMLATLGRLGEALCVKSAEHDLHAHPRIDKRVVFAFESKDGPTRDEFAERFDVLHRTFLGYPLRLAPAGRLERFYNLYRGVASRGRPQGQLTSDELGWVAVCSALVQHPETGLY